MPKIVDHSLKRRELARAALSVIGDTGLDGLRLADVGKAAGATTGSVTHYLGDKNAVLMAALDEVADTIAGNFQHLKGRGTPEDLIDGICNNLPTDDAKRRDWRVWIAYWGGAVGDRQLADRHQEHYDRFRRDLADHIRRLPDPGGRAHPPEMIADLIISSLDGVGTRAALEPDHWPPDRQHAHLRALLEPLLLPAKTTAFAS